MGDWAILIGLLVISFVAVGGLAVAREGVQAPALVGIRFLAALLLLVGLGAAVWGFTELGDAVWRIGLIESTGVVVEEPPDVDLFDPFNVDTDVWVQHDGGVAKVPGGHVSYTIGDEVDFYVRSTSGTEGAFTTWPRHALLAAVRIAGAATLLFSSRKLWRYVESAESSEA